MQSTDDVPESYKPENLKDALNSQDAALCKLTGEKEYNSIISNKTWTLATLTSDRTAIKSRLIFKVKPGIHGAAPRYKARSVAKNYSQRPRIDFDETFAPVAKQTTLRTVLSYVAAHDLEMCQLDIKTVFLYGELAEEIYLGQPEGYAVFCCRLNRMV